MNLATKLEGTYLNILRYAILIGATIALITVVITGLLALGSTISSEPKKPTETEFSEQANEYKKGFSLNSFRTDNAPKKVTKDETPKEEQTPAPKEDSFQKFSKEYSDKIATIFVKYFQEVDGKQYDKERISNIVNNYPRNNGIYKQDIQKFYFETLLSVANELDKEIPKIKLDGTKKIDIDKMLQWHIRKVYEAVDKLKEENAAKFKKYQEKYADYLAGKAAVPGYLIAAASAFGVFLAIIWTLLLVKIELNLRPIKEIAESSKTSYDIQLWLNKCPQMWAFLYGNSSKSVQ